ncbi:MAG: FKBP-type peptidyl-prolyl cis-trans isomerase [Betaproteobacteria bacterium]|jgi:FKBP-type peptidyl-prolyl cis-trans isomerase FkpA|nr:FKBP-type peptidyl-prolyl cis-trans isomerase [Betaproteobacteria bacterium]MBT6410954.1 FKBP-type peptidyl-prolyl cis-trans isomerase [Betaproteobacteria bacterium]
MKKIFFITLLFMTSACSKEAVTADVALETENQKTLYAIGMIISNQLQTFALSEEELAPIVQGMMDGIKGEPSQVDMGIYEAKINELVAERSAIVAAKEAAASNSYLEQFESDQSIVKTASGALVKMLEEGTGETPGAGDTVMVHYEGTLIDGTVFDSSLSRGSPATFPLSGVIPCWTEGLQKIKVGGKAQLICPANTAYGERGVPPKIGPGATLIFEVNLLEIKQ